MNQQAPLAIRRLELKSTCDICGKPSSSGHNTYKHVKCSRIKKEKYREQ